MTAAMTTFTGEQNKRKFKNKMSENYDDRFSHLHLLTASDYRSESLLFKELQARCTT